MSSQSLGACDRIRSVTSSTDGQRDVTRFYRSVSAKARSSVTSEVDAGPIERELLQATCVVAGQWLRVCVVCSRLQLWQRDTRVLQWTKAWLFKQHDHYCWEISPPHASLKVYRTLVGYPSWWILHTGTRAFEDEASGAVVGSGGSSGNSWARLGYKLGQCPDFDDKTKRKQSTK